MRWIGWIAALVLGAGWLLSSLPPVDPPCDRAMTVWRRTADGWERADRWFPKAENRQPSIHPLVAGGFGLLVTILGMAALAPVRSLRRDHDEDEPRA